MDVVCNHCNHTIKIPDKKVPKGKAFSIGCPKCKKKVAVKPPAKEEASPAQKKKQAAPKQTPKPENKPTNQNNNGMGDIDNGGAPPEDPFEFLEEGAKTAILCETTALKDQIKTVIEKMEYNVLESASPRETLKQMRFRDFDLIILNELFGTRDPEMNHVLKYLSQLNMISRRNMFVVLISERFRTGDNMQAYNKSVNMIINSKDMNRFEQVLDLAIKDNERFYRTFKEAFAQIKGL